MKNLFIPIAGFLAITNLHGQCAITPSKIPTLNEITTITVGANAQCDECYSWKSSNEQVVKIEGNNKLKSVNLAGKSYGKSTISVSILTDNGVVLCEKNIEIVDPKQSLQQNLLDNSCGINIDDFKDVKVSESIISFFPNANSGDYLYKWTVTYANGETSESTEKIPQFTYSENNYITTVKLKISNKVLLCSITLSKKFDANYWKASKNIVEQKVYSPISYSDYVKPKDQSKISN
ncbi:hypothetical protein [Epilithonimonas arachidiradicis]|nr:hypothetical protein [Epilithonimonas arachidiradicis]GGG61152.1 hypothetical protein GCM10007332_23770 [Epilithonimonas arachidiradicis]